jgi:hypothetical protein
MKASNFVWRSCSSRNVTSLSMNKSRRARTSALHSAKPSYSIFFASGVLHQHAVPQGVLLSLHDL